MRRDFAKMLYNQMLQDSDVYLVTADLGYGLWDDVKKTFPDRFFNIGSSEMAAMGVCIGLAMEGKKPFFYSITPFAIYRPFEMIRNYIDHECIPVTIVGGGRDRDYGYLGFSHWCEDDEVIMKCFKNISFYKPTDMQELQANFNSIMQLKAPAYINLKK
jgi:transketolase